MSDCRLRESRIPSSLVATYVQYKKDTGAVIAWLISHGTGKYRRLTEPSLHDLNGLAEIVKTKAIEMPGTINFQFREAIAARNSLSKWYRKAHDHYGKDDQDTCNHEHFTTCLSNIYIDLCQCCSRPKDKCTRGHKRHISDDKHRTPLNRFATLDLGHDKQPNKNKSSTELLEIKLEERKPQASKVPCFRILGDALSEAFELRKAIQDMHDLVTVTRHIWTEAAHGKTSIVVAHLCFAEFEEIEDRLNAACSITNPRMLWSKYVEMEKYMQMEEDLNFQLNDELEPSSSSRAMIEDLIEYWRAIDQVRFGSAETLYKQASTALTIPDGPDSDSTDKERVSRIFKVIGYHLAEGSYHNSIIRLGSPVNNEICLFLTKEGNDRNGLRCSFGLQLLLQSNRSFFRASSQSSLHTAGRLQALEFAQEGTASIKAALSASNFACQCPRTIAGQLVGVLSDLEDFMKKRGFDLYFKSYWVSGSHTLEMLDALFSAGLRLFNYQNYASSVLHTYNILNQLNLMSNIPILDKLLESELNDVIFPGGLPNRNFKACYARSLGGRLRFDSHHQKAQHRSGCHSMTVPSHIEMVTEGIREPKCDGETDHRFDVEKLSLLHYIKSRRYHPTKANLERVSKVDNEKQKTRMVPKVLQNVTKGSCSHGTQHKDDNTCPDRRLKHLGKAIHAEVNGSFPVARINFFSIYLSCLRIVSVISDKYHATLDDKTETGQNCVCFTHALMGAADRCREDENQPFGYKRLVEICQEAIENELLEKDLKDFLWKEF